MNMTDEGNSDFYPKMASHLSMLRLDNRTRTRREDAVSFADPCSNCGTKKRRCFNPTFQPRKKIQSPPEREQQQPTSSASPLSNQPSFARQDSFFIFPTTPDQKSDVTTPVTPLTLPIFTRSFSEPTMIATSAALAPSPSPSSAVSCSRSISAPILWTTETKKDSTSQAAPASLHPSGSFSIFSCTSCSPLMSNSKMGGKSEITTEASPISTSQAFRLVGVNSSLFTSPGSTTPTNAVNSVSAKNAVANPRPNQPKNEGTMKAETKDSSPGQTPPLIHFPAKSDPIQEETSSTKKVQRRERMRQRMAEMKKWWWTDMKDQQGTRYSSINESRRPEDQKENNKDVGVVLQAAAAAATTTTTTTTTTITTHQQRKQMKGRREDKVVSVSVIEDEDENENENDGSRVYIMCGCGRDYELLFLSHDETRLHFTQSQLIG